MPTEDSPPTCSVDSNVIASIRQTIAKFIQRCGLQYTLVVIDQALYTECCQEAINRGFPMSGGDYSIRSYMGTGVAMSSIAYGHLADHATGDKRWIICTISTNTRPRIWRSRKRHPRILSTLGFYQAWRMDLGFLSSPPCSRFGNTSNVCRT